jgi:hypothetical protein
VKRFFDIKKYLLPTLLAFSALTAATRVNQEDVRALKNSPVLYLVGYNSGAPIPVIVDPNTLQLDTSTSPPMLRAVSSGLPGQDIRDEFVASAGNLSFQSSGAPKGATDVFRNGLLQREGQGNDYATSFDPVSKRITVTFSALVLKDGDSVTLRYVK